uniref:Uncharacterized protein n=1 Tax=Human herpesvirus 2 TaxID=10310 RepID=A0A481TGH3_HHV2|nr:hypothetical protein [Human alphaherpesvirus 2]QBH82897.1 hypothetical protein [Human alphaherpesvirus 2]
MPLAESTARTDASRARRASWIAPCAASASPGSTLNSPQNAAPVPPQTANFTELAVCSICRQTAAMTPPSSCRSAGQASHASGTRRSSTARAQGSEGAAATSASSLSRPARPRASGSPASPRPARAARSWAWSPEKQNRAVQTGPTAAGGSSSWMVVAVGCHRATASRKAGRRRPAASEATAGHARGGRTTLAPTAGQAPRHAAWVAAAPRTRSRADSAAAAAGTVNVGQPGNPSTAKYWTGPPRTSNPGPRKAKTGARAPGAAWTVVCHCRKRATSAGAENPSPALTK